MNLLKSFGAYFNYCSFFWEKCSMGNAQVSILQWIYQTKQTKNPQNNNKKEKTCRRLLNYCKEI